MGMAAILMVMHEGWVVVPLDLVLVLRAYQVAKYKGLRVIRPQMFTKSPLKNILSMANHKQATFGILCPCNQKKVFWALVPTVW